MWGRHWISLALLTIWSIVLVLVSAEVLQGENCYGAPPHLDGVIFKCVNNVWHSNGNVHIPSYSMLRFVNPVVIHGNLTMEQRAFLVYEPNSLSSESFITVLGCATFNHSIMSVNLTRHINQELVYAQERKQKNHWLYLMALETSCPHLDVSSLTIIPQVDWDYGVSINSTLVSGKNAKNIFFSLPPGHTGIQIGLLGGSPMRPQNWFTAMIVIFSCCILIVIISESIHLCTGNNKKKSAADADISRDLLINGDD